jgi:glycosyltransferase involved in cell wall biosynthesis
MIGELAFFNKANACLTTDWQYGEILAEWFAGDKRTQILLQLLANSDQRDAMGQAALERASTTLFSWDRIAAGFLEQMNNPHHNSYTMTPCLVKKK